jgi:hypothetical protein
MHSIVSTARTQRFEGDVNNLKTSADMPAPGEPRQVESEPDLIAIGLLKLQQRLEALDRLYNEEIGNLSRELTQLKADYVRLYQARASVPRGGKPSRGQARGTSVES